MERRLGRGLGSLLSSDTREKSTETETTPELPLARIRPNPFQPRVTFDPEALRELQQSIEAHGILQPVVVRPSGDGFELISGERRFRASQAAGLTTIPAIVRDVPDEEMLELALVENVQRQDLDPLEKARGYRRLVEKLQLTQEQVAEKVGLRRSTVANHLRLLELPGAVQEAVAQGLLSMGHARALLGLAEAAQQELLCAEIVRQGLSVRAVEERVRRAQEGPASKEGEKKVTAAPPPWVREMEGRMRGHLGTKVQLKNASGTKGQIVISYHNREELERVYALLAPRQELA